MGISEHWEIVFFVCGEGGGSNEMWEDEASSCPCQFDEKDVMSTEVVVNVSLTLLGILQHNVPNCDVISCMF